MLYLQKHATYANNDKNHQIQRFLWNATLRWTHASQRTADLNLQIASSKDADKFSKGVKRDSTDDSTENNCLVIWIRCGRGFGANLLGFCITRLFDASVPGLKMNLSVRKHSVIKNFFFICEHWKMLKITKFSSAWSNSFSQKNFQNHLSFVNELETLKTPLSSTTPSLKPSTS